MSENGITASEARRYLASKDKSEIHAGLVEADRTRRAAFGDAIELCSIINAKCGSCGEDCAFCAQSASATANVDGYPLLSEDDIFAAAQDADGKVSRFSVVTSGRAIRPGREFDAIIRAIHRVDAELDIVPCASLGVLELDALKALKDAGLRRYHHNLETCRSHFPSICTTRSHADQTKTVENAKRAGLSVCAGGIFGLGESLAQRVELLEELRSLEVDSVPINFLVPIKGTRAESLNELTPLDCLKIIAAARLMMPDKTIRVCGGRERNLRDYQSWIFLAGANGLMTGGYLTTPGRGFEEDARMILDGGSTLSSSSGSPLSRSNSG